VNLVALRCPFFGTKRSRTIPRPRHRIGLVKLESRCQPSAPTAAAMSAYIDGLSQQYKVPAVVIKALVQQESRWNVYATNPEPDGRVGMGLTQITLYPAPQFQPVPLGVLSSGLQGSNPFVTTTQTVNVDVARLTNPDNWQYNLEIGVRWLVAKKVAEHGAGDDATVLENWYYPLAAYNGLGNTNGDGYPDNDPAFPFPRSPTNWMSAGPNGNYPYQECVFNIIAQMSPSTTTSVLGDLSSFFGTPVKVTLPGPSAVQSGAGNYGFVKPDFHFFDSITYFRDGRVEVNGHDAGLFPVHVVAFGSSTNIVPTATLTTVGTPVLGQGSLALTIKYQGNVAINTSTLDNLDIWITGPAGYNRAGKYPTFVSSDDGRSVTATYLVTPSTSSWSPADNGQYRLWMQPDQVKDSAGHFVAAGLLGSFTINISADYTPPTVNYFEVRPRSIAVGNSVTIWWAVADADGSGLKRVELWRRVAGGAWAQVGAPIIISGNGPLSGSFNDTPPLGEVEYGVHVVDGAGLWNDEQNSQTGFTPGDFGPVTVTVASASGSDIEVELPSQDNVHRYDFRSVEMGDTASVVFTVRNKGMQSLNVSQLSLPIEMFHISFLDTSGNVQNWTDIPVGSTRTFKIMFSPIDAGSFSQNLILTSNDPEEGSYLIALSGSGVTQATPSIKVTGFVMAGGFGNDVSIPPRWADTQFGFVSQNSTPPTRYYVVTNTGTGVLELGPVSLSPGFTLIEPPDSFIPEGGSTSFVVTMNTDALGTFDGNVAFTTNAWKFGDRANGPEGTFTFEISGEVRIPAPVITGIAPDTGSSATDNVTNAQRLLFRGTAVPYSTITMTDYTHNPVTIGATTADASGNWTFDYTSTTLADGFYQFFAKDTDQAGQTSFWSGNFRFIVDTAAPGAPAITGIAADTGVMPSGGRSNDPTVLLSGTAEAGSTVTVSDNRTAIGTTIANSSGVWTLDNTASTLLDGQHVFSATAPDVAGNHGPDSAGFIAVMDTNAPTVNIFAGAPRPSIHFSEPVSGLAIGDFQLRRNGRPVSLIDLAVGGAGDSYTLDLSSKTAATGTYVLTLKMAGSAIRDAAGNASGASVRDTWVSSVGFRKPKTTVRESTGTRSLWVDLRNAASEVTTVDYAIVSNTATAGADFTLASGTLVFLPGQKHKPIQFTILEDAQDEFDETFSVVLTNPTNAIVRNSTAEVKIVDNDPRPAIGFALSASSVREGILDNAIEVTLSTPSAKPVAVKYAVPSGKAGGTASNGTDYLLMSGVLTFAPGETSKLIQFHVPVDALNEGGETINVELSKPTNARLLHSKHSVTILDDDPTPPMTFATTAKGVGKAAGLIDVTVGLSAVSG
jgi:Bacterial Ig-like domain/Calx-beta domain